MKYFTQTSEISDGGVIRNNNSLRSELRNVQDYEIAKQHDGLWDQIFGIELCGEFGKVGAQENLHEK